jgi:hypothetical protein
MRTYAAVCLFLCAGIVSAQDTYNLDEGLRTAADYFNERLSEGTVVAILNIQSDSSKLSEYIINGLTEHIANNPRFHTVDRNLSLVQGELALQASGDVSNDTAQSIGQLWGAQVIISGSFIQLGGFFQLTVKAIAVETGENLGLQNYPINTGPPLRALLSADGKKRIKTPWFLMQGDEGWKHKWLYPAIRLGVSPHWYELNTSSDDIEANTHAAFEAALSAEVQIRTLFALQTELIFSGDRIKAKSDDGFEVTLSASALTIPVLAKLTFRPGNFYAAAFAGPYFTIPLGQLAVNRNGQTETYHFTAPIGITGGANAGIKLGPGLLFLDLRYNGDLTYFWANDSAQFRSNRFSVSLGYNYGFFNK